MKAIQLVVLTFLFIGLSCKEESNINLNENVISTYYLIRHAEKEKGNPDNHDPELNQQGLGRAMHWSEILDDVDFDAIYSTDYNRTAMTAAPLSVKKNVDIQYYDTRILDMEQFKADNINKNVLIVGHSNTTPDFVNSLIGTETYSQIDDYENGTLFIVKIVNKVPTVTKLNFNCNP